MPIVLEFYKQTQIDGVRNQASGHLPTSRLLTDYKHYNLNGLHIITSRWFSV